MMAASTAIENHVVDAILFIERSFAVIIGRGGAGRLTSQRAAGRGAAAAGALAAGNVPVSGTPIGPTGM